MVNLMLCTSPSFQTAFVEKSRLGVASALDGLKNLPTASESCAETTVVRISAVIRGKSKDPTIILAELADPESHRS